MVGNKGIGTAFEQEVCALLKDMGYWVHFIVPDIRGAQPFDIIAVKDGKAIAIDCKTCVAGRFNANRLEDNQIMAFAHWLRCGNDMPMIFVKHNDQIYVFAYEDVIVEQSMKFERRYLIDEIFG